MLPAFAVTVLFGVLGFLLGWFLAIRPIVTRREISVSRALAAWTMFVLCAFALLTANQLAHLRFLSRPHTVVSLSIIAAAAAIAGVVYWGWRPLSAGRSYLGAIPVLAVEAVVFGWMVTYPLQCAPGAQQVATAVGFALLGLLTLQLFRKLALGRCLASVAVCSLALTATGIAWPIMDPERVFQRLGRPESRGASPETPRVLLITVDTLRRDALSCYNPDAAPTPNIDRLAADSVVFRRAYSTASWTLPAIGSLMTGLPAHTHRLSMKNWQLLPAFPTLAERLRSEGYLTGAAVVNAFLRPQTGIARGFVDYAWFPKPTNPFVMESLGGRFAHLLYPPTELDSASLTELALDWLRGHGTQNYFFWLHYLDPRTPYAPPPHLMPAGSPPPRIGPRFAQADRVREGMELSAEEKAWIQSLYLAEVRLIDEQIGRILDFLNDQGSYQGSLIIFTSDHGEEFWEHGGFEHGHSVFEEVIAVPLMVKLPALRRRGSVSQPVSIQSIPATIFDVLGVQPAGVDCSPAPPMRPYWETGSSESDSAHVVSRSDLNGDLKEALIYGHHKYVHLPNSDRGFAYDLADDPTEARRSP